MSHAENQVLEFTLGSERYCVDIDRVSEILDNDHDLTDIPDAPRHIEGVTNLRGQTAQIVNPKAVLGLSEEPSEGNIVVFETGDDRDDCVGWLVDTVHQVRTIEDSTVDESVGEDYVNGIVQHDAGDDLLVWVDPDEVNAA